METVCKPDFGGFKIKVDNTNINVGGNNYCVNLILRENKTELYWLKTEEGGSELDDKIFSQQNMVDVAFSIFRKYYPDRQQVVELLDDSGFNWKDKKDKKYKINFLKCYLLLHRKTWYEDKFNATIADSKIYSEYKIKAENNFDDPGKKPTYFDFRNNEIKSELEPLYNSSNTWGEFIDKLVEKYKENKYRMIYDWYRYAICIIFDGMEINQDWKIDISKRPYINCIKNYSGGIRNTIKKRNIAFSKYHRLEPFIWTP